MVCVGRGLQGQGPVNLIGSGNATYKLTVAVHQGMGGCMLAVLSRGADSPTLCDALINSL